MTELKIRRLSHALGAEVKQVDLDKPLAEDVLSAVRRAWADHLVLLFRGQDLSPERHIAFSRHFGELDGNDANPFTRLEEFPEILQITNKQIGGKPSQSRNVGRNWHSDLSYTRHPAIGSLLYCKERPEVGGDTMFTNMYLAYETLSGTMRGILDGLEAVHDFTMVAGLADRDPAKVAEMRRISPPVAHPVIRVHPESGRRALFVSQRVRSFVGMTEEESRPILDFLCRHATRPEFTYRHQWEVGDLLMWDNRCTMHLALADFDQNQPRLMLRTSLLGEAMGKYVEQPALAA